MSTNLPFVKKFASSIVSVLGCHDRVVFKGHLPFHPNNLNFFADSLGLKRRDFIPLLEHFSQELVDHAVRAAADAKVPYQFISGEHRKEDVVREHLAKRGTQPGLVVILCCMETCRAVKLVRAEHRPELRFTFRPQRVLYFYFLDPELGLLHVRLQTWFPYDVQVCVNGHDWLARRMAAEGIEFTQRDNAFTHLADPERAQKLADEFPRLPWVKILDRFARVVNPLLKRAFLRGKSYYWVIHQAEFSTDLMFRKKSELQELFPRLVDHALQHFSPEDVLRFLGRRLHPNFDGEVLTMFRGDRDPGTCVKHRMKGNVVKMYDKFGLMLRVETVINQPREFHVRRRRKRNGVWKMVWCSMNKGVANFYRYHEVAAASNARYLSALAAVDGPAATKPILEKLQRPVAAGKRRRRGLNLLAETEQRLFAAILRGEHRVRGFRNREILARLHGRESSDAKENKRRMQRLCRQLQLLRAHGLIAKVGHTRRYLVTPLGESVMTAAVRLREREFPHSLAA